MNMIIMDILLDQYYVYLPLFYQYGYISIKNKIGEMIQGIIIIFGY